MTDAECAASIQRNRDRIAAWREGNLLERERERNRVALDAVIRDRERRAAGMSWAGAWKAQVMERV